MKMLQVSVWREMFRLRRPQQADSSGSEPRGLCSLSGGGEVCKCASVRVGSIIRIRNSWLPSVGSQKSGSDSSGVDFVSN